MDIISLPVEYDDDKIDGKYRLVAIASQRAKDLSLGSKPKIQTRSKKVTSIAIEEAVGGQLEFLTGEEAVKAKEEAGKFDYRKLLEESRKISAGEDLSELEKDLKVYLHERETMDKKAFDELFSEKKEEAPEDSEE
ncbi:MAG TPA: DNA-directed RNA polymerase subunit omega [Candidatus Sulfobium mesophilum]|jgi:DNA-directed RNA polymerase subunit omega|uniref:DNA-directed RNA polymerase subunit omega n=1 Tax=Candidatus Sulfobium mesophilum TaxID=2016548 RepID=A0A2U3QLA6_9BACT|nr:DNA-directed RNA polymerase subunit omega [Candidatus Sulfobium mesophilum]HSB32645.1 DNA-directed RNA polymerase subunit omega [Candidatus Sulfobium mesophilum]